MRQFREAKQGTSHSSHWGRDRVTHEGGAGHHGVRVPALRNMGPPSIGVNEAISSLIFLFREYHDQFA